MNEPVLCRTTGVAPHVVAFLDGPSAPEEMFEDLLCGDEAHYMCDLDIFSSPSSLHPHESRNEDPVNLTDWNDQVELKVVGPCTPAAHLAYSSIRERKMHAIEEALTDHKDVLVVDIALTRLLCILSLC